MVGSSGVWRVGCMWRVEECEVECVRMDGEMMGIYTIYIYIYIFFIYLSFQPSGVRPALSTKKQHITLKALVVIIEKNNNRNSNSSNNRKE